MKRSFVLICLVARFACSATLLASNANASPVLRTLLFVDDYHILYRSGPTGCFTRFNATREIQ